MYDDAWLRHPERFPLDPAYLPLTRGAFNTTGGQRLFGGLSDSAPHGWGRMLMTRQVFNVLICCTDDHLRNHGFLHAPSGWVLSPAYDLNPVVPRYSSRP